MNFPLVSIITVTLNCIKDGRKDFLIENFNTVHRQTYPKIEHIIVDGASTDGTVKLLDAYRNKGWISYISERDNGIYDAMNKGHLLARGEYVLVLNSDDWYTHDNIIEKMVKIIVENNADYVYGHQICCSRDGKKRHLTKCNPAEFWHSMPFNHPTIMIKKSVVKQQGYYRTDFDTVEDYRFVIQLILDDYKGIMLDEAIVNFRLGGVTMRSNQKYDYYDFYYRRLPKVYYWFYKKFDNRLTELSIIDNYVSEIGGRYDKMFFIKLIRFMIELKLQHFDYEKFFNYIDKFLNKISSTRHSKKFFLLGIPIVKIENE